MKNKEKINQIIGADAYLTGPLANVADRYTDKWEAKEVARKAENMSARYDVYTEAGKLRARKVEAETTLNELRHNLTPLVSRFDAYKVVKNASKQNVNDQGLKLAAFTLENVWMEEPTGYLTVADCVSLRDRYVDMFPKSAVRHVVDNDIFTVGFHTLGEGIEKIAEEVTDQESYERVVQQYGFDGDTEEQLRARFAIQALFDIRESDSKYATAVDSSQTHSTSMFEAMQNAVNKFAQIIDNEPELDESESADEFNGESKNAPVQEHHDEEQAVAPHDEESEELTHVESPYTGEDLVLELGLAIGSESDEIANTYDNSFNGSVQPNDSLANTSLMDERDDIATPDSNDNEKRGVEAQFSDDDVDNGLEPSTGNTDADETEPRDGLVTPNTHKTEPAGTENSAFNAPKVTTTTIKDPSSGKNIKVTLETTDETDVDAESDVDVDAVDEVDSDDTSFHSASAVEHKSILEKDKNKDGKDSKHYAPGGKGYKSLTDSPKYKDDEFDQNSAKRKDINKSKDNVEKLKEKNKTNVLATLTRKDVFDRCAELGVTVENLEADLLNGEDIVFNELCLHINASDKVCLDVQGRGTEVKTIKTTSIANLDQVAFDFMTRIAVAVTPETRETYIVYSEVPTVEKQTSTDVARRIMASVFDVIPQAEGELMDDGRLAIIASDSTAREINRLHRVLVDIYGVQKITANKSPYKGKPPVEKAKAGKPGAPMTGKMQTPETGGNTQAAFIEEHTKDPAKQKVKDRIAQVVDKDMPVDDDSIRNDTEDFGPDPSQLTHDDVVGHDSLDMIDEHGMGDGDHGLPAPGSELPNANVVPGGSIQGGVDLTSGKLTPEDDEAVKAAMLTLRNTNPLPLSCLKEFSTKFSGVLDKYGDESSPARAKAEAAVLKAMVEAFNKPAVIPVKASKRPVK